MHNRDAIVISENLIHQNVFLAIFCMLGTCDTYFVSFKKENINIHDNSNKIYYLRILISFSYLNLP